MKRRVINSCRAFVALLLVLSFSGCDKQTDNSDSLFGPDDIGDLMYSTCFSGSVTDEAGNPVSGIKVSFMEKRWSQNPANETWYERISSYSRVDGTTPWFRYNSSRKPANDDWQYLVQIEDVDGDANGGAFQPATIKGSQLRVEYNARERLYYIDCVVSLKKQ